MPKDDKMTRDIRNTLKKTFGATGRYASGTAKLFLASSELYFKEAMPAPVAMFETNKDILIEFWRTLRNPSEAANKYGNRITQMESYKELKKFANNALDDIKSGKLYDKDRDRSSFGMEIDNLMDDFGGFDMTGFDENGDWSEDNIDFNELDTQIKIAEAQESGEANRTEATIDAIGTGTEAIVRNQQAIASNELRIGMKEHSQLMSAMQNMITQQATGVELQAKSINALLDVTREAHNQMLEQFNRTNELLTEIRDYVKPVEDTRREYDYGNQPFGYNGELNIKEYFKNVTKNVKDKFLFGGGLSTFTGGFSVAQILDTVQDNPLQLITDLIVPRLIPNNTKEQMKRTNRNIGSFLPALFTKMADRGKRFETGESEDWKDALMGIFGIEQRSRSYISTEREDYLKAAKFTDKTTRAIEEVIPTLLAKIDSSLTGDPLMIYDYKQGKFVKATSIIASGEYDVKDLAGKGGETTWKMMQRANSYRFRTTEDSDQFKSYMYDFLQKMAEESRFINKNMSKDELIKMMPSVKDVTTAEVERYGGSQKWSNDIKRDQYADMILAILRKIDPSDLQEMSRNMIDARAMRDRATHDINRSNEDTGRGAAWSGLLNPELQEAITTATRKQYGGLTEDDIKRITETKKSELSKVHGISSTNNILGDILTTLHGGIITYTYHMGRIKDSDISSGNTVISKQVQESLNRLETYRKKEEDRLEEIRKKDEEKKNKLKQEMDEYNKTITNMNRTPNEMYADSMGLMDLEAVQEGITLEEYSPDDPKLKELKEKKDKYQNYGKLFNSQIDKITEKGKKFSGISEKFRQITKVPFELFNKGMQLADAFMLKALYGDDINLDNFELWQGRDGEPFLLKTVTNALNVHFKNAKNWFVDEIGDPLKNYFFGKEDGLFPKIKAAAYEMFGIEEKKQKIKDTVNEYKNKALNKIRGVKNEETGLYEGGWFSKQFNDMGMTKNEIKDTLFSSIKNGVDRLMYGDLVTDKGKINTYDFDENGNMITGKAYSGVIGRLKQGFDGVHDMLFGPDDNPDEDSRNKFKYVKDELSNAFPNMVVGTGAGVLASLFLPGGPLLGAVIGSTLGLVKGSDGLKQFLFGDTIEEDDTYIDPFTGKKEVRLGPDGKPIKKKTRKGNLISKDVYEGFKKFAPKVTMGAILGTVAGGLGLLPLGLGSTAGMVVGSMAGMIGASDQMKKLIFGKEGDDDSGLISKNFRKSVIDWGKKNLPTTMLGALGGGAAWSLISNVGLIPGLAMLPGGPILGFLGASVGLANADNIKAFFFGEEEEIRDPETGKVKKQRQGGIFGKAFDTVRDKIMTPIAKSFNFAGEKTKEWFQENIIGSMKRTMEPMKDALADAGKQIEHAMKNIGNGIVEALFGKLDDTNSPRYKFHKFWNDKIMGKLKDLPNKIFGGIGKAIGFVLSSPFKAAEFIFTGKIGGKTLEQRKVEKNFKKRHKKEMKTGQYEYLADEDSEWGILNLANRAKRKFVNAFTTYSPDAMALIRSGRSLNDLEATGEFEYFGDRANSVRKEMYEYFGRQEDEENRHKTRSAKQKMLHDLEGRVNKRQTLGLLPGQAVKGYMTEQDYMRGLGFDDRIVNTEWAKRNISIDTFLQEGGAPDIKAYKAWVTGKIDDEKKKFDKKRKREARDAKWQQDEERWKLNAINRRRARKGLPPLQNLKDYDEATDIITKNYEGQTADNPDAILDENGHVIHEVDANGNYTGLVKTKKKHWYDGIAKQFKADHVGPNRNQSWMDSFTGYLDEYGSDKSFMDRYSTTPKDNKNIEETVTSKIEEPQIPTVNTTDPTMPKVVPVKLIESQLDAISNSNNTSSNIKDDTAKNEMSQEVHKTITTVSSDNETAELPQTAKKAADNISKSDETTNMVNNILPPSVSDKVKKVKDRLATRGMTKAQLSAEAEHAAKEQKRIEERREEKELIEEGQGYIEGDKDFEDSDNPNEALDRKIKNVRSKHKFSGMLKAYFANMLGGVKGEQTETKTAEDKKSLLDTLLGLLPMAGGLLAAIAGGIASIISLVAGIGAGIGALTSGAVDKAMRGVEVLAHGFLKRFGFSTMKGATFEDIGKVFTNAKVAREMSEDAAEASAKSITKRAARKNKMSAKGLNRAARWADIFESIGKAAKGDKAVLARMAEDASERGLIGGLGMRIRQGIGRAIGTGARGVGEGLGKLGTRIADSGFVKAAGAAAKNKTMLSAGLRHQAEAYGKYSKTGVKAGENVGKVFKTVKDSFAKTLEKFFNLNIIKNTKFGKFGNKVANAILNGSFWAKVQEKFLTIGGKEAAQRVSLKALHVVPVLTLGFAIADFTIGMSKAKEYFGVFSGDVTEGMRFTAGVVNCLEGLIAAIPVPPVVPLLISVALSFFTGEIAQAVYNAIASDDAKEELKKNQNALQKATDEYNKTHENKLTTGEYAKNYNKDGTENNTTIWQKIKTFLFDSDKNKSAANITNKNSSMRYANDGTLVGKGKGLSEASWGIGGKYANELYDLDYGTGIGSIDKDEKKSEVIKEVNSRLREITDKKKNKNNGIKFSIVDSTEKEEIKKEKEERKEITRKKLNITKPTVFKPKKKQTLKDKISNIFDKLTSFGSGPSLSNNKIDGITEEDNKNLETSIKDAMNWLYKKLTDKNSLTYSNKISDVAESLTQDMFSKIIENVVRILSKDTLKEVAKRATTAVIKSTLKNIAVYGTVGILEGYFLLNDIITAYDNTYKYFKVHQNDVTMDMHVTACVVGVLQNVLGLLPIPIGPAITAVIELKKDELIQTLYSIVTNPENVTTLTKNQSIAKSDTDKYNKKNDTNWDVAKYTTNYDKNGNKRELNIKSKNTLGSGSGYKSGTSIQDKIKNIKPEQNGWGAGNKITPISQHSSQYNQNNRLMADAGCGPTSAAMVASAYGVKLNPEQISNDSFAAGMRASDGGMNPKYFSQMADKYGSGFGMKQGPVDGQKIQTNLSAGRPVVMMGKGGPYGPTTHYMVAEGLTDNGKVKMIDPNNGSRKTVTGNNLIKNSTASVYSYGTGAGIKEPQHSKIDSAFRYHRNIMDSWGRGTDTNSIMLDTSADNTTTDSNADINIIQQTAFSLITKNGRKGIKYIVLHYTTQTSSKKGAARAVCSTWANKGTKGSADYVVDDAEIIQYNPDPSKHSTWHCGGGLQYSGKKPTSRAGQYHGMCTNSNSIGIEMSSNNSTGRYENDVSPNAHWYLTPATIANAARLTKYLMKKYNVPIENVIMHHDVTGKICPQPWCCNEAALNNFQQFKQQVMGASVGNIGTVGGTTIDSSGTSGTTGKTKNSTKGIQMLDSISTLFKKISNPFNNLINKLLNTEDEISTESNVNAETATTNSSSNDIPSVTGSQGSKEDNAKYIYKFMKSLNVPDDHIAAVLSNWTAESGIDPTGVETIYSPKYKMSEQKMNAMADPNAFSLNVMFPKYARSGISIHKSAYKGDDGKYYPGIGLGGFTGPAVSGLLRKSQEINKPWYDLETQLRYMTDPSGSTYKRGKYAGRDWIDNVFIPQKFSSPSQGAAWFEKNWEGSTFRQAEHMRTAQEWYDKIQSGVWGSGEGLDIKNKDIEREIAKVKPHEIDNRTGNKQIPETDMNWEPGWGAGNKSNIKSKIRNAAKTIKEMNIPDKNKNIELVNTAAELDGYEGDVDTKQNSSFGAGRRLNTASIGKWGRGSVTPLNITNTAGLMAKFKWAKTPAESAAWGNVRSKGRRHAGIDLHHWAGQVPNAPIQSFTSGVVYQTNYPFKKEHKAPNPSEFGQARGNYVVIKDENNVYHIYQHLNPTQYVKQGDSVGVGQVIGAYGNTGYCNGSTGLHLHYEVRTSSDLRSQAYNMKDLAKITHNPEEYLKSYSQGKPYTGDFSETGTTDGTTTDSEGVSGTEGTVEKNEPSGIKFLNAVGDMFTKFSNPFDKLLGALLNQGVDSSTSEDTNTSTTNSGSNVNVSGNVTSKDSALKYMYNYLSAMNVPDVQIAGVLSNFSMENGADPTSFEADFTKYPNTKYQADPNKLSVIGTGEKFPDWDSIDNWTRNVVWKKTKGIYKPGYDSSMPDKKVMGVGIGSWTGKVGEDFLNYAKSTGKPWYDMKTQMDYFTNSESLTRDGYIAFDKKYRTKANMQEWWKGYSDKKFSSPTEAARWYFYNAEMPSGSASQAAEHIAEAQSWYDNIQQWKNNKTDTATDVPSTNTSDKALLSNMATNIVNATAGKGSGIKVNNQDIVDNIADVSVDEFGTGEAYNVKSMNNSVKELNKTLKKTNTVNDISTGFSNVSKIARSHAGTYKNKEDDTTAQILAFLTENIGTLIKYVSTIADRMPVQKKTTDVQKNLNNTKEIPTVNANNMYAPTPTGNDSEDVGMRIMNSLTSK